ncbi:TBC1 domain family member 25 isoform X1 [Hydra vulgaris]|uniref:TBC1 domain family member 25 n=1 Tax=Hydra vulgaris TaxID=6087 RepID=T2MCX7_HYDVU|nr:TBC1 domain family member 25 [Hydra vulgaris]
MFAPFSSNLFKFLSDSSYHNNPIDDQGLSSSSSSSFSSVESGNCSSYGSLVSSNSSSFELISSFASSMWYDQPPLSEREAIQIVAQCSIGGNIDCKTMTVDPNITNYSSLFLLLKKAFNLNNDFDIAYLLPKSIHVRSRPDVYLSLMSDWDLDAAFHTASYPIMQIKVVPALKGDVSDWDVLDKVDNAPQVQDIKSTNHYSIPSIHSIKKQMSKQINKMFDVLIDSHRRFPVSQRDWNDFFDPNGRIISSKDIRISVFHGGLEPSLRKEAWVHLLGVYPSDLTIEERARFLQMKARVYNHLKEQWLNKRPQDIDNVMHMVQKDVLRTDRTHPFFNVPEDHPNIVSLFNILTTFALNNPEISYCQGMSDLAAPLLVVIGDEVLAYLSFCKVMERLRNNFLLKGTALLQKFGQLSLLLQRTDEKLYKYFQEIDGGNLYFCYRMLLLELKREFPFDEALTVMEVIWSSVPPDTDDEENELCFYYTLLHSGKQSGKSSPLFEGIYRPNYSVNKEGDEGVKLDALPHPRFLNDGSPFPLFLCLAVLLINRENIITNQMDYSMLAMFFDKMSRKHDSWKVLTRAKSLFYEYLRAYLDGQTVDPNDKEITPLEGAHGTKSTGAQC